MGLGRISIKATEKNYANIDALALSPGGRFVAICQRGETMVRIFDVLSSKEVQILNGHLGWVTALEFSPDGRWLASGSEDTTVLIWDMQDLRTQHRSKEKLTQPQLAQLWNALLSDDQKQAGQAILTLSQSPEQSVVLFKEKLQPVPAVKPERLTQFVKDLDSEDFQTRETASRELAAFGELAEAALVQALKADPTAEQERRLKVLLLPLQNTEPSAEQFRPLRAIKALEYAGTAEALRIVENARGRGAGCTHNTGGTGCAATINKEMTKIITPIAEPEA